jgi:hypothetical protein
MRAILLCTPGHAGLASLAVALSSVHAASTPVHAPPLCRRMDRARRGARRHRRVDRLHPVAGAPGHRAPRGRPAAGAGPRDRRQPDAPDRRRRCRAARRARRLLQRPAGARHDDDDLAPAEGADRCAAGHARHVRARRCRQGRGGQPHRPGRRRLRAARLLRGRTRAPGHRSAVRVAALQVAAGALGDEPHAGADGTVGRVRRRGDGQPRPRLFRRHAAVGAVRARHARGTGARQRHRVPQHAAEPGRHRQEHRAAGIVLHAAPAERAHRLADERARLCDRRRPHGRFAHTGARQPAGRPCAGAAREPRPGRAVCAMAAAGGDLVCLVRAAGAGRVHGPVAQPAHRRAPAAGERTAPARDHRLPAGADLALRPRAALPLRQRIFHRAARAGSGVAAGARAARGARRGGLRAACAERRGGTARRAAQLRKPRDDRRQAPPLPAELRARLRGRRQRAGLLFVGLRHHRAQGVAAAHRRQREAPARHHRQRAGADRLLRRRRALPLRERPRSRAVRHGPGAGGRLHTARCRGSGAAGRVNPRSGPRSTRCAPGLSSS